MQPYLFPYIGYWQLINAVNEFVVYDDVNYISRGWINRNNILVDGKAKMVTLALSKASINKRINEIGIASELGTKEAFLNAIARAYRKAPFYGEVFPILEKVILNPENNIAQYILTSIESICSYLEIPTKILLSSEIPKDNSLRGDDKIVRICEILGAETYINPSGGMAIYDEEKFRKKNIELFFLKADLDRICYTQFAEPYVGGLSIVDVLMFNSIVTIRDEILPLFTLLRKE